MTKNRLIRRKTKQPTKPTNQPNLQLLQDFFKHLETVSSTLTTTDILQSPSCSSIISFLLKGSGIFLYFHFLSFSLCSQPRTSKSTKRESLFFYLISKRSGILVSINLSVFYLKIQRFLCI